jgi:hypothetical protein
MFNVSARSLKILSGLFWYIGGIVLMLKGGTLLFEADTLKPDQIWAWLAIFIGLLLGGLKAKFFFSKSCQKNLTRIGALERPKLWQFFRPNFFVFMFLMIITGTTLSQMAHNNYPLLIGVAILDFSIAIALIGSSYIFWRYKAFRK